MKDSPVEVVRKQMPRGTGQWKGFDHVYGKLQEAAEYLAKGTYTRCNEDHVRVMAAMGSGDEETMKGTLHLCYTYGWAK